MSLRHGAALAFVSWYLITPLPLISRKGKTINPNSLLLAPLSQWRIIGTFATQNECEAYRDANPMERCIATDDPRLKEK
jgi:hypothetical protein